MKGFPSFKKNYERFMLLFNQVTRSTLEAEFMAKDLGAIH